MRFRNVWLLLAMVTAVVTAANAQSTLTNADVIKMVKSGMSDQTIVLMIQKATSPHFDTSADAMIELKKAGASDAILNAILSASSAPTQQAASPQDCSPLLDRAVASYGSRENVATIRSIRWSAQQVVTNASGRSSATADHIVILPSNVYTFLQQSNGMFSKVVLTPEFNYFTSGKMTTGLPPSTVQQIQDGIKTDPLYIAEHRDDYSCVLEGTEQIGNVTTSKLKVRGEGLESEWNIDISTGRLMRTTHANPGAGPTITDFSDWRQADTIYVPFVRHIVTGAITTDITIDKYEVNPTIDASVFQPPSNQPAPALTLKVLQEESVPYVVQTNGGISTNCNISGSTNTTMTASTYGNTTYGTATSTPNLQMNCNSSDNTIRWNHVLNAMFVEASDGNAYIIACDRAWRWSKCTPLRAGDTFLARRTDKGFVVQSLNGKLKEQEETYSVLQSKSLHE